MASENRKPYRKKGSATICAVQLNLDTDGFSYEKWGGEQRCKSGDWLVDNADESDAYAVGKAAFNKLYEPISDQGL